jgi:transcriptional regulator with XRE-family HTH domain
MYFAKNIKFMRKRRGRTQDEVAFILKMKRSTLSGYENEVASPGISQLIAFSDYLGVAIDTLVKVDLTKLKENQLRQLEEGYDVFIKGSHLRVLATTVDKTNKENIELVPEKASAGYTSGYSDPEYVKELPAFNLPFLSSERKYRTFQVRGESMLPVPSGSWVTGEYVQDWNEMKNGEAYIVLTVDEGIIFKIVENRIQSEGKIHLISLNRAYEPYDLPVNDIREMWRFVNFISEEIPVQISHQDLAASLRELRNDVSIIKKKIEEGNDH